MSGSRAGALAEFDLGAEVLFHQWRANGAPRLARELDQVLSDGRTPVLSLLPRPYGIAFVTRNTLLEDIGDGDYDSTIRSYARAIGMRGPSAVVVRFAPEMELEGAHVWSQGKPDAYIRAYRHLVEVFRAERATNVVWMWSPAGNDGADKFYPGDDVVDVIGVTILASEAWDKSWGFAGARSFERLLDEKYRWAEMFDRPLVVAEAGVSTSSPADAAAWLAGVPETLARYPRLRGFCYFNANQPVDTPEIDVFPDWRLASPDLLFTRKPVR
jgi:endoglucanase